MPYGAQMGAGFVTPVPQRGRMHALPMLPGGGNPMATNPFASLLGQMPPGVGRPGGPGNTIGPPGGDRPIGPIGGAAGGMDPRRLALLARMRMARHGSGGGMPSGPGPRFRLPVPPGPGVPTQPGGTRGPVRGLPIQRPQSGMY